MSTVNCEDAKGGNAPRRLSHRFIVFMLLNDVRSFLPHRSPKMNHKKQFSYSNFSIPRGEFAWIFLMFSLKSPSFWSRNLIFLTSTKTFDIKQQVQSSIFIWFSFHFLRAVEFSKLSSVWVWFHERLIKTSFPSFQSFYVMCRKGER